MADSTSSMAALMISAAVPWRGVLMALRSASCRTMRLLLLIWGVWRRRQTPQINSSNRIVRQEAERSAINTPLQGTAADIIKAAMLEVESAMQGANLSGAMLLQIHDELLFEVPRAELADTVRLVRRVMEGVVRLKVPLTVDLRVGENWGEMNFYAPGGSEGNQY